VRVNLVVVGDQSWQLTHYGFGIWSRTDADIVALDRANEGFSHSVASVDKAHSATIMSSQEALVQTAAATG
jgi:hypothetical protein